MLLGKQKIIIPVSRQYLERKRGIRLGRQEDLFGRRLDLWGLPDIDPEKALGFDLRRASHADSQNLHTYLHENMAQP